ncbi:MAG: HEPN domain-containing protein [Candidatus Aenigmarchaeota archaeon]|nr:HEPN domain-containing protein [Candidatus Aenigmarchaeota archaeon]
MDAGFMAWLEKARKDLTTASKNYGIEEYEAAAVYSQQSAEKALKAVLIKKTGKLRKIHDLIELGRAVGLPEKLLDKTKELTMAYIYSRYPDAEGAENMKQKSAEFLESARRILEWCEKNL